MGILDELLDIEHAGWVALCNGTADEWYGDLMTEHAVMILANGMVVDRDGVVASLRDAPPWASYEIADPHLWSLTDDVHALVYTGTGHRAADAPFIGAMTSVYVRHGDRWRLALYQQTPRG